MAIVKCRGCPGSEKASEYQDAKYGRDMRVANITAKGQHRCTCCGKEHGEARVKSK